ncbi:hypothetical protein D9M69_609150 [compost metagenome]
MPRTPARTLATRPPSSRNVLPSSAEVSASSCFAVSFATFYPLPDSVALEFCPTFAPPNRLAVGGCSWIVMDANLAFMPRIC